MAKTTKKAYRLSTTKDGKKIITIDDSVKMTEVENNDINRYVLSGYIIRHKSVKKSELATERAKKQLTNKEIIAKIGNNKELLEAYTNVKKESGFFSARKWYKEQTEK